jgi:hypothetical protein
MAFLDWIKRPGTEHIYRADHPIKTIWKGEPYTDGKSTYSVQACLGMSEKGYHSGLSFTPAGGEEKTTWNRPVQRRDRAMAESYSTFNAWVGSHEAHSHAKEQRASRSNAQRHPPSWER